MSCRCPKRDPHACWEARVGSSEGDVTVGRCNCPCHAMGGSRSEYLDAKAEEHERELEIETELYGDPKSSRAR